MLWPPAVARLARAEVRQQAVLPVPPGAVPPPPRPQRPAPPPARCLRLCRSGRLCAPLPGSTSPGGPPRSLLGSASCSSDALLSRMWRVNRRRRPALDAGKPRKDPARSRGRSLVSSPGRVPTVWLHRPSPRAMTAKNTRKLNGKRGECRVPAASHARTFGLALSPFLTEEGGGVPGMTRSHAPNATGRTMSPGAPWSGGSPIFSLRFADSPAADSPPVRFGSSCVPPSTWLPAHCDEMWTPHRCSRTLSHAR